VPRCFRASGSSPSLTSAVRQCAQAQCTGWDGYDGNRVADHVKEFHRVPFFVRAMLERATGYEPSVVEGRFHVDAKLMVVVTPYEVSQ
jgi:hypothetical protein